MIAGKLVVAWSNTASFLKAAGHGLGARTVLVASLGVGNRALAGLSARDHGHDADRAEVASEPIGNVTAVSQKTSYAAQSYCQSGEHRLRIASIAWGDVDDGGTAEDVGQERDFGDRPGPRGDGSPGFHLFGRAGQK